MKRPQNFFQYKRIVRCGLGSVFSLAGFIAFAVCVLKGALAAPPQEPKESIVCRGTSGEGFSYWWGGECWCADGCVPDLTNCGPGDCTPDSGYSGCPHCTHSGTYGADCSGFVSKAWQVPDPYPLDACHVARYVAADFTADHSYWNVVSMNDLQPGDAVASTSHVILVIGERDAFGDHEVVEAMGCNYGIVRHSRSFSSVYSGARRINLTACVCSDGDAQTEACGDCGTRSRSCEQDCLWSPWTPCAGPDPTGAEAICTVEGGVGVCGEGRRLCVAGWLTCRPNAASTEVCDALDNDCDGQTDNGTPESLGEGYPCTHTCGVGVTRCIAGAVRCATEEGQWPVETCDSTADHDGGTESNTGARGGCGCRLQCAAGTLPGTLWWLVLGCALVTFWVRRRMRPGR
jgi:hypothetical protein